MVTWAFVTDRTFLFQWDRLPNHRMFHKRVHPSSSPATGLILRSGMGSELLRASSLVLFLAAEGGIYTDYIRYIRGMPPTSSARSPVGLVVPSTFTGFSSIPTTKIWTCGI